ncbi:MAG: hypothetical protein IPK02_13890 [Candidatus Accumulibacter sp.]|uniref:PilY1 beta-propeller domain-containing protein n=1 Tax=Candidatus Accumulibacter affinis TaxID=2954384 RepID=A0A935TAA0_9PROT|nr:hypothetical protein [Candidatus Accumulibacter affinis]
MQSNTWQLQSSTAVPQSSTQQLMTRTTDLRVETSQLLASKAHLMASTKTEAQVRTQTVPQSSSGQLWRNALTNSESYAAQLQYQESKLQKKESTLQFQTSQLQTQSSTLQKQTTPLLQTITRVQEQTSNDGGVTLSAWKDVAPGGSCDEVLSGDFRRSCRLAGTTTAEASSCLVIAYSRTEINPGKDNHFWRWTTGSSCAYGAASGYSNAVATCEAKSRSTGGEGSTWIGPATDCQYTAGSGLVDAVGSCTAVARSSGPSYDVLTARDCQYTAWTAPAAASSACTNAPRSDGPTYTVLNARNCAYTDYPTNWTPTAVACTPQDQDFKNLIARQCLYTGFGAWMDTNAKCTPEAEDPTNYSKPVATQCRYSTYTWKDLGSPCQKVDETANPGPYTVAKPVSDCRSTWTGWGTSSTCEVVTGQVDCKYEWTAPVNDASCPGSAVAPSGGPKYTVEKPKACSNAFTGWSAGVCPDPLPQGTECRTGWKPWANTDLQCTKNGTKDDLAAPVGATDCSYAAYAWLPVSSCTTVNKSGSSPFKVIEAVRSCTYGSLVNGAWTTGRWTVKDTKASTCKQQQSSGAFPWTVEVATRCTYPGQPTGWTTAPQGCTLEGQSGNDFVPKRECQYGAATTAADDASCPASALGVSPSSPYTVAVAKTCSYRWTSPVNIASCKENATTRCTYAAPTGFVNAATCAEAPQASGPDYPGSAQACQTVLANPEWTNVAGDPCSEATSTVNGLTTSFRCVVPPPTEQYVAKCDTVDQLANDTNHGVTTDCKTPLLTETKVDQCTPLAAQDCPTNNEALCKTTTCRATPKGATPDTLADVAQYYYMTDLRDDTALHNCAPDGDNARNVCESPDAANSDGKMQRMTTYTLGLGASGLMQYAKDYPKAKEADGSDFASIRWATTASPTDGICSWQHAGVCNWPTPVDNSQTNIDDLWHAAVNGRGTYFSAGDPSALAAGISSALADIGTAKGALAAVTLASANLLTGGNGVYEVSFEVGVWAGDVAKRAVNGDTGEISDTVAWSAEEQLRKKMTRNATQKADHSLRTIYTYDAGTQDKLKPFLWDDLSDVNQAFLSLDHINGKLSQFCSSGVTCLGDDAKLLASGKNLLNFLRGDNSNEGDIDNLAAFYRKRSTSTKDGLLHRPLGDIAGSEAVYVQAPPWNYVDKQYSEFKAARKDRTAMVYVGANDGMLHAFEADTGKEAWAYVPALVFSRLYQLADKSYAGRHLFTVDGTPVMGDICADSAANCASASNPDRWKTILVGGLNAGGRGYYALDVSNPATPKALWEFRNDNLGYTYGNPVISKLKDGTWVVIVASGYNNVNPGDGKGRLFILNANTGELMTSINADGTIVTAAGDATTPSGLARITAWANFPDVNNTAERVYGGDLQGNLWRFDINGDLPPDGYGAQRLATLTDPTGKPQPITTRPELGKVRNYPVVFIGTGKLLGPSDFNPIHETAPKFQQQSFYAIKDRLTEFDYGDPRKAKLTKEGNAISAFNTWTLVAGSCPEGVPFCRTLQTTVSAPGPRKLDSETSEQYAARLEQTRERAISDAMGPYNDGWYIDLPSDGEQSNTDPNLQRGSVVFTSNRPLEGGGCVPKAASSRYFLDYRTGGAIEGTNGIIGVKIADALATRAAVVVLTNDQLYGLTRTDQPATDPAQIPTPPPGESARRISWRELSNR